MSTVLTNGIIIPDNGSRNWGGDLANNWNILDVHVGYMTDVKNRVTTLENSVAENTANIQINTSNISALQTSKQDVIEDLETIRAGATAGATAVQPSALSDYATKTELNTKANNSDVVHNSGNEFISGVKNFNDVCLGEQSGTIRIGNNGQGARFCTLNYDGQIYNTLKQFIPQTNEYNLGTSTNKWKSFNGINPGALSLPNPASANFIGKSLPSSGGTITADVDAWLEIRAKATSSNALIQLFVAGGSSTYAKNAGDDLIISIPLRGGVSVTIFYRDIETPTVCRLVPCLGNV